ncbi:hypothetical protein CYY_002950 [Polysphondylium violaceum]|uniref:Uncharacterized protein n=1 Tax=Polysphondylium violaceum TaxID=133409 RepID=A0A8J4PVJ5_9MYCE|nr:hypothetical protein CYY_002950 [Polysphondylium violaceum]
MNSFTAIFRNCYLRSLIRNQVFRDKIIRIPNIEYLDDNQKYLSVFTNDDKLNYNISIKLSIKRGIGQTHQFKNNKYKHIVNDLVIEFEKKQQIQYIDFSIAHDQVHRLSFYLEQSVKDIHGKLPDSIIDLNIGSCDLSYKENVCLALEQVLSDLPNNLRVLKLSDLFSLLSSSRKIHLPSSIIDLQYTGTSRHLDRFVVDTPNKVLKSTCLKVESVEDLHWLRDKYWINNIYFNLQEATSQIPAHVRKIKSFSFNFVLGHDVVTVPAQLESLEGKQLKSNQDPISKILKQFLPHLKLLDLLEWDEKFEKETFPQCLEHLKINQYDQDIDVGVIPSNLKTLELDTFDQELNIGLLPNNITNLILSTFNQPLKASVLPTQLKQLELSRFNNTIEPNTLPISLRYLYLDEFSGSFEQVGKLDKLRELAVYTLNQSMVDVLTNVKKITIFLTNVSDNTSLTNTPITDLCFVNYKWTPEILRVNFLPTTLVKLELRNFDIQSIDTIPPSCLYLKYNYKKLNRDFVPKSVKWIKKFV